MSLKKENDKNEHYMSPINPGKMFQGEITITKIISKDVNKFHCMYAEFDHKTLHFTDANFVSIYNSIYDYEKESTFEAVVCSLRANEQTNK